MSEALHLQVEGRVQGVVYRESMRAMAARLRVDGWVRNRVDGSVEAVVRGSAAACQSLLDWARRGPPAARVSKVDTRPASAEEIELIGEGFQVLPTC